jgi:azurin
VPDALALFQQMAQDEHPRVRLEAVRAASFYRTYEAANVALSVLKKPLDYYLEYALGETLRQLEPYWKAAVNEGKEIAKDNPAGVEWLIGKLNGAELEKLPRTPAVLTAVLMRPGVAEASRLVALNDLAEVKKSTGIAELLQVLPGMQSDDASVVQNLARLMTMMPPADLKAKRDQLQELAEKSPFAIVRRSAWAALALADDSFDKVWDRASASKPAQVEMVSSIPLILDPTLRDKAAAKVKSLVIGTAASTPAPEKKNMGRYVRIELPRVGTLTLAEVQVLSGGKNIALNGRATQSGEAHGGAASKAIDGKTDSSYGSGTQTHTPENMNNPWWELDLGAEQDINSIVVWNRSADGEALARRLDGFTLAVLDGNRREVFKRANIPAPAQKEEYTIGTMDLASALRKAAVEAYVAMPSEQEKAFATLTELAGRGDQVPVVAQALRALPRKNWSKETAGKAAPALIAWAKKVPLGERMTSDYVQTIQVADELAGILPTDTGAALRKELKDLRVAAFVVRTVREQMRFDTTRLVVEAGKPFQITVENADFMPHNFVILRPGTREKVGTTVEKMKPDQLDSKGRAFMPRTRDIVEGTRLLEADQREVLQLNAPQEEGIYEFVCTFPGHWQVMWGQLVVTKNVDDYLQKNPEAPAPVAAAEGHAHHGLE